MNWLRTDIAVEQRIQNSELISLLHSHFHAIGQAALACNDNGCSIGDATEQLVCIAEALAEVYFDVAHLAVLIYVYEALA